MQGAPLFPGDSEIDQIFKIFRWVYHQFPPSMWRLTNTNRILGTPNEEVWPGVSELPDYKPTFPQWSHQDITRVVPTLDEQAIDMLKVCIYSKRHYYWNDKTPCEALMDLSLGFSSISSIPVEQWTDTCFCPAHSNIWFCETDLRQVILAALRLIHNCLLCFSQTCPRTSLLHKLHTLSTCGLRVIPVTQDSAAFSDIHTILAAYHGISYYPIIITLPIPTSIVEVF